MEAEAGFGAGRLRTTPARLGFICLIFGLLSFFCRGSAAAWCCRSSRWCLGSLALRRSAGQMPVGTGAAMVGLVLAAGFGACGLFLPWMKTMTLGARPKNSRGITWRSSPAIEDEFAMELRKDYVNRFPTTMSLKAALRASMRMRLAALAEFREDAHQRADPQTRSRRRVGLKRPYASLLLVRKRASRSHLEQTPAGRLSEQIQYVSGVPSDHRNGDGQWHVDRGHSSYREPNRGAVVLETACVERPVLEVKSPCESMACSVVARSVNPCTSSAKSVIRPTIT